MKFSYSKNPESEFFFIKNPNLTKKIWRLGGEGVGVWLKLVIFFSESKSEKKFVFFLRR